MKERETQLLNGKFYKIIDQPVHPNVREEYVETIS